MKRTNRAIDKMRGNFRGLGNGIAQMTQNINVASAACAALSSSLLPLGAVAVGVGGALAASFTAAGVAVAGFGALSVSVLNDVFEASSDLEKINERIAKAQATGASQKQINKLYKERALIMGELSKEQKRAANALATFKSFWDSFAKSFEKPVVDIFVKSLSVLQRSLEALKPAFQAGMAGISQLMDGFSKYTEGKGFQTFVQWIASQAAPAIVAFGTVAGNVIIGLMNLFKAFTPLTGNVQSGLVGLSERFRQWSETVGKSQGFQSFINYVKSNSPALLQLLEQLGEFLIRLVTIMAPVGTAILDLATRFLTWVNNMMQAHPTITKLIIGFIQFGGVLALIVPKIMSVVNVFATFAPKVMNVAKVVGGAALRIGSAMFGMAGRALMAAGRMALSWVIAMGPVGWVIAVVVGLVALVIANWDTVKSWTIKTWNSIANKVKEAWNKLKQSAKEGMDRVVQAVKDGVAKVKSTVGQWVSAGKDLIMGLVNGIKSVAGRVVSAALSTVKSAINKAKAFLGIHSPAKMTIEMGQDFGAGFAIGIGDMIRQAQTAALTLANTSVQPVAATAAPGSRTTERAAQTTTVVINNYGRDLSGWDVANALRKKEWLDG
jgi:hypothetical protein